LGVGKKDLDKDRQPPKDILPDRGAVRPDIKRDRDRVRDPDPMILKREADKDRDRNPATAPRT